MRKTYRLRGMDACKLNTIYCGIRVALEFKSSMIKSKKEATLTTSNPFIQDAIENDVRFGKVFSIMAVYDDSVKKESAPEEEVRPARKQAAKKRRTQEEMDASVNKMSVNDAIAFLEGKGEQVDSEDKLAELAEKHGIVIV